MQRNATSLLELSADDIHGKTVSLGELCEGKKAILVVNAAAK